MFVVCIWAFIDTFSTDFYFKSKNNNFALQLYKMASNNEKEEAIRGEVIAAAQKLFQAHGPQKVTMEDVAAAVGKAKSSLYYYYKSKDEIWTAVLVAETDAILAKIVDAVGRATTVEGKINAFCFTKLAELRKTRAMYHLTYGDGKNDKNTNHARRRRYLRKESVVLSQIIIEGIAGGELRPIGAKELEVLVFVLLSGLHGLEKEMTIEEGFDLGPAVDALSRMIVYGLKSTK